MGYVYKFYFVLAQESVVITLYYHGLCILFYFVSQPENLSSSRYITARRYSMWQSEWVSFWSCESIIFILRETVSHAYFPYYVYKRVMYINFIFISPVRGVASWEVTRIARFFICGIFDVSACFFSQWEKISSGIGVFTMFWVFFGLIIELNIRVGINLKLKSDKSRDHFGECDQKWPQISITE